MKRGVILAVTFGLVAFSSGYSFASDINAAVVSNYLKGILYLSDRNYDKALESLEIVKEIAPESAPVHLRIAFILLKLGREADAEAEFKQAKFLDPDRLEASVALTLLYASQKEEEKLEKEYRYFLEKAHQLRPNNLRISEYLGQFYFYKKMAPEAVKVYETIVKSRPDYAEGYFWLGYLYEEAGRKKDAVKMWKKTLEMDPSHLNALNSLGYTYADEGKNLDEAEAMIKKALEKDPDNGAFLDSLGWVYYKKEEYQKAKEYLLKALEHLKEAVIYEHVGDLYMQLKDEEEAVNHYRQGLALDPDNESLKQKVIRNERRSTEIKETVE